jgi:hypothetical protein
METARGCWWGERQHCTFCGLNGATMAFRSKTPDRVVSEIRFLCERHGVGTFSIVDDILDMRYFRTVLPRLADAKLGIEFFWEVKANLTNVHVRQLRDAGVLLIQPGIESLSDHVLKLMRKGTTAFRNIELMKWCREYGVKPYWNLLYGFPGETDLRAFLDRCVEHRLMVTNDHSWLAVAVHVPAREVSTQGGARIRRCELTSQGRRLCQGAAFGGITMNFIERLFGISPDGGSGSFEFVLLLILGLVAYVFSAVLKTEPQMNAEVKPQMKRRWTQMKLF